MEVLQLWVRYITFTQISKCITGTAAANKIWWSWLKKPTTALRMRTPFSSSPRPVNDRLRCCNSSAFEADYLRVSDGRKSPVSRANVIVKNSLTLDLIPHMTCAVNPSWNLCEEHLCQCISFVNQCMYVKHEKFGRGPFHFNLRHLSRGWGEED